ncbi:beta-ketoacyl-[acyl-carrier-protein] synthase family protein [Streptomyces salinarius]|uniref:beta-ketoacyl-[acyl-carrier-protein] synthase family protein n=1 Tax=Streptomyces salinarius TaxID=2762598 RepID=UPI0013DC182B|nr:beta-ketoacyl-[acyl-carrier-protein] synthase family protein [Streptomyces salinarius]
MTAGANRPFHAAVTGFGMVTAAGLGAAETWEALLAGRPTARRVPELEGLPVDFACRAQQFDGDAVLGRRIAWRLDRSTQMAMTATTEALQLAGLDPEQWDGARVGVVLATALGGMTTWEREYVRLRERGPGAVSPLLIPMAAVNMTAGHVAAAYGAKGPNFATATACASSTTALGAARDLLRANLCDVVIAGGTEASITPLVAAAFAKMGALSTRTDDPATASRPFDAARDGFVLAEGASVLVLERPEHARARGARPYAFLSGYGASADAGHATRPDPGGAGAESALRSALVDSGLAPEDVDHVNAHGTSTPLNDAVESQVTHRVLGDRPAVSSIKGVTGHCLGAAGAHEAVATVLSLHHQVVPPTANVEELDPQVQVDVVIDKPRPLLMAAAVSHSFGFGGQNAVVAFTSA